MGFQSELDGYLNRSLLQDNLDFEAVSAAEATFSPSAQAGADFESRDGPWEIVPVDDWMMVLEATPDSEKPAAIVHSFSAADDAPQQAGLRAAGASKQSVASRGAFYASTDYIADGKLAEIFWEDPMSKSTDEESAEEEEERSFFAGQRRQAKVLPVIVQLAFT